MVNDTISEKMLIEAIKGKADERKWALKSFFQNMDKKNVVVNYVMNHGGNYQDGQDIFQDAVILFDRAIRENIFKEQCSLTTYFIGIAKWRWVSHKRKFNRNLEFIPEYYDESIENVENCVIEGERLSAIETVLTQLGERCKKILKLYKMSYSMAEIAETLGLESPNIAKQATFKCRGKFKEFVLANPNIKELLDID